MRRLGLAILAVLVVLAIARGQEEKPVPDQPQWKSDAAKAGLDEAAIKQLDRDGLLIADQPLRQAFSVYVEGKLPTFITSDAVLNAFHVLFEESVKRLEETRAESLRELLVEVYAALPKAIEREGRAKPDEIFIASMPRARMVLAVALRLLGEKVELSEDEAKLVEAEVRQAEGAVGSGKPEWLGKPDKGFLAIDYTRFKPLGFYTDSTELQRYFRANRWLQTIPFRVDRDEELAAALLIGWAFSAEGGGKSRNPRREMYFYDWFLGTGDDLDLAAAADRGRFLSLGLENARESILDDIKDMPAINDQLRFIPENPQEVAELSFRLMPSFRLPDAVLFQRTTNPEAFERTFPQGLEVAAMLGNGVARDALDKKVLAEADRAIALTQGSSMYCESLRALATLNAPAEKEAPALFRSTAWQVKSCNTQLAGWAQMRHAWLLQAKENVLYAGLAQVPAGFVEPNPEFWCSLAALCERTQTALKDLGALRVNYTAIIQDCRALAKLIEDKNFSLFEDSPQDAGLTEAETETLIRTGYTLMLVDLAGLKDIKDKEKRNKEFAKRLRDAATDIEGGNPKSPEVIEEVLAENGGDLDTAWTALISLIRRIETLSHKQLRGIDFNEDERKFIQHVGQSLASCMFYGGNSWLTPRDDAPRAAVVASNPQLGKFLHVGIGRPRVMYILYEWKSERILCKGAVLPYAEFTHATRLTDTEWTAMQSTAERPAAPEWLKPIIEGGKFNNNSPDED
ncbi:MAG: DUF3160 domain-containing protein [Planctomycetes bacterium]|nr:DUF3160 domain-containing protein [Planctomycetota bacterium]